jgi:crotonobetainyl-CoA:carnitine CoA-transferase CaiB-like acyl-CoA transferase
MYAKTKALGGLRVIDAGVLLAGPFAASLLGDLGADVIKVEHPRDGDPLRRLGPQKEGVGLWWKVTARNKRCITLDLGKKEGAEIFLELVRTADVLIENFRPGTFERWGLDERRLREVNRGLVFLRVSGYGQTGPYRRRPAFGRMAEAMGGLSNLVGDPDGPPAALGYPLGDLVAGLFGALGVMTALYWRDAGGGGGQTVDIGMYEAVFRMLEWDPIAYDQLGLVHGRLGTEVEYAAPSGTWKTREGRYVTLAATTERVWKRLLDAMGRPGLGEEERFQSNELRMRHREEVNRVVAEWVAERSIEELGKVLDEYDVPWAAVYDIRDIFRDEQYREREMLLRVKDEELGEAVVCGVVPKLSETPGAVHWLGPRLGEHNEEVYCGELGFSRERLEELRARGVI